MTSRLVTVDTSAAVKWFLAEDGSDQMAGLLHDIDASTVRLVLASHVVVETVAVAVRAFGSAEAGRRCLEFLGGFDAVVLPSDATVLVAALDQCDRLGCSFYDAFAPAIAELAGAELWTADTRAHAAVPGAVVIGG